MTEPRNHLRRADLLYKQKKYELARSLLMKALEQEPGDSSSMALMAACHGCMQVSPHW
ncbi:MAG: tetratricopeptide repeat protein [Candidatus Obscuribacterales bacterium]|nr:tetratricopeptide repeat protein [Candidatus Obscuribacterales bacterium]